MNGLLATLGGRTRRLSQGEVLFREGEAARDVAEVASGRLVLRRHLPDGSLLVIDHLGIGDLVAEGALAQPHYGCEVAAAEAGQVRVIAAATVRDAMAANPAFATMLVAAMASRIHRLRTRLALRAMRPARRRVLAALALDAVGEPPVAMIAGPLAGFAEAIGLTPAAFYRTLAALEREGAILRAGQRITLAALRQEDAASNLCRG
ncbi:Crp/Fnr family transcriptional regulator [Elioraea sp.]|uniref:Crp/Fnr family transcriptional regulator n=1 Tax=Elioraea sp. TaxID=2185103 RepID=UPI0025C54171|nr:Crp/Fnr family transcriptional regulator [Elioraea sp.]